jgi:hypothetical protein
MCYVKGLVPQEMNVFRMTRNARKRRKSARRRRSERPGMPNEKKRVAKRTKRIKRTKKATHPVQESFSFFRICFQKLTLSILFILSFFINFLVKKL